MAPSLADTSKKLKISSTPFSCCPDTLCRTQGKQEKLGTTELTWELTCMALLHGALTNSTSQDRLLSTYNPALTDNTAPSMAFAQSEKCLNSYASSWGYFPVKAPHDFFLCSAYRFLKRNYFLDKLTYFLTVFLQRSFIMLFCFSSYIRAANKMSCAFFTFLLIPQRLSIHLLAQQNLRYRGQH